MTDHTRYRDERYIAGLDADTTTPTARTEADREPLTIMYDPYGGNRLVVFTPDEDVDRSYGIYQADVAGDYPMGVARLTDDERRAVIERLLVPGEAIVVAADHAPSGTPRPGAGAAGERDYGRVLYEATPTYPGDLTWEEDGSRVHERYRHDAQSVIAAYLADPAAGERRPATPAERAAMGLAELGPGPDGTCQCCGGTGYADPAAGERAKRIEAAAAIVARDEADWEWVSGEFDTTIPTRLLDDLRKALAAAPDGGDGEGK